MYVTRKKRKNLFGSGPWANRYILATPLNFVEAFDRTILVTSGVSKKKNTDEKP